MLSALHGSLSAAFSAHSLLVLKSSLLSLLHGSLSAALSAHHFASVALGFSVHEHRIVYVKIISTTHNYFVIYLNKIPHKTIWETRFQKIITQTLKMCNTQLDMHQDT